MLSESINLYLISGDRMRGQNLETRGPGQDKSSFVDIPKTYKQTQCENTYT